jgi:hypothetical protein
MSVSTGRIKGGQLLLLPSWCYYAPTFNNIFLLDHMNIQNNWMLPCLQSVIDQSLNFEFCYGVSGVSKST